MLEASAAFCTPVVTPIRLRRGARKTRHQIPPNTGAGDKLVSKLILVSLLKDDVAEISSPLRDPDDNPILSAAIAYNCKFLVTGDDDLLELKSFSGVEIVSVRAFAERLQLKI